MFPAAHRKQIRLQLASGVKAAIAQRLIPRRTAWAAARRRGPDRHAVRQDCIVDKDKTHLIAGRDRTGHVAVRHADVRSVDLQPVPEGADQLREALAWATNVDEFKLKVQGISTTRTCRAIDGNTIFSKQPAGKPGTPGGPPARPGAQAHRGGQAAAAKPAAVPRSHRNHSLRILRTQVPTVSTGSRSSKGSFYRVPRVPELETAAERNLELSGTYGTIWKRFLWLTRTLSR